jgi:hypothetical protein
MTSYSRTFYEVVTHRWVTAQNGQTGFWAVTGSGPGGNTIEEAYKRVKQDIKRMNGTGHASFDSQTVKIKITKIEEIKTTAEEITGSDFTAFMLKTA